MVRVCFLRILGRFWFQTLESKILDPTCCIRLTTLFNTFQWRPIMLDDVGSVWPCLYGVKILEILSHRDTSLIRNLKNLAWFYTNTLQSFTHHKNIKFIKTSEGRFHGTPKCCQETDCGHWSFSTWQRFHFACALIDTSLRMFAYRAFVDIYLKRWWTIKLHLSSNGIRIKDRLYVYFRKTNVKGPSCSSIYLQLALKPLDCDQIWCVHWIPSGSNAEWKTEKCLMP